ncbi:MAG: translocation/assembly module TamB [Gemmatimonadetes bacterium]|nr:translocation/assembly module TamB [Gemmatimonadota bacterium]MDA1103084.1 translocation/assembly module TamB [Gemmatimonadota bacterium]
MVTPDPDAVEAGASGESSEKEGMTEGRPVAVVKKQISRLAVIGHRFRRGITLVVLMIVLVVVLVTETARGHAWILQTALDRVRGSLAGELSIGSIRNGTLLLGATLTDVRLDAAGGREFLRADSVVVRYSLLTALVTGSPLRSTTFWGLDVEISQYQGEEEVNVARVLVAPDPESPERSGVRRLSLGRIGVREGRARVLTPADPASTAPTVLGPSGEPLRQLLFDELDFDLEAAVVSPGSAVEFDARLVSFSSTISTVPDPFVIREVFGRLTYGARGIRVADAAFRMPNTLFRGHLDVGPRRPGEAWVVSSELDVDGWGDLEDLGWIDPRIPEGRFRGRADIAVAGAIEVDFDQFEVELEASHLIADGHVAFGAEMSMQSLQLTASPIALARLEPWLQMEFPLEGWISGRATFSGTLLNLNTVGRMTLVPTGFGGSPTTADFSGTVHRGANPGATGFRARLDPLNYTALQSIWPDMPVVGNGFGRLEFGGRVGRGMTVVADFTHRGDAAASEGMSRVTMQGLVSRESADRWVTDMRGEVQPLSVGLFARLAPTVGLRGSLVGSWYAQGGLDELAVGADLTVMGGRAVVDGTINVRSPADAYRIRVEGDSVPVTAFSTRLPERSFWTGGITLSGTGFDLDSLVAEAQVTVQDSRVGSVRIDAIRAGLRLSGGVLMTDSLMAEIAGVSMTGRGQFGVRPGRWGSTQINFESPSLVGLRPLLMGLPDSILVSDGLGELERDFLRLEGIDPDTLPTLRDVRLVGGVSGSASLSGQLADFDVGLVVDLVDAAYKANQVDSARVGITATGLPGLAGSWQVGATALGIVVQDREFAQGGFEADMVERRGSGGIDLLRRPGERYRAQGNFGWDSLGGEVSLSEAHIQIDEKLWQLTQPGQIVWSETTLRVDSLLVARTDGDPMTMVIDGTLNRGGESDFHIDVEGLHVEEVLRMAQLEQLDLGGHVDVQLTVHGPSEAPTIDGTFRVDGPRFGQMQLTQVEGSLDYSERLLGFGLSGQDGIRQAIEVNGTVPLDLSLGSSDDRLRNAPLDIRVRADSLDAAIALSFLTTFEEVVGTLSADVHIGGTPDAPEPDGVITLKDAAWSIEAIGVRHTAVSGELRLHPDRTVDVSLISEGVGSSTVTGTLLLEPLTNPALDLTFTFQRFAAVSRPDVEGLISGQFLLSGRYERPVAQGALRVDRGTIYVDEFQRAAGVVDLSDPSLFDRGIAVDTTALVAQPLFAGLRNPFFDNLRVNVDLSVPSDTWLRSNETNVEMGGNLLVRYDRSAGDFVLIGELQALRGSHLVLGRTFGLDGGTVNFIGRPGLNPDLDIRASTRIRRPADRPLNVTALVEGTLIQPIVTLSTDEVGYAQSDLVSYLIFGQPSSSLGGSQGQVLGQLSQSVVGQGLLTYASGALANRFGAAIARGLTLDYLSVQSSAGAQGAGGGTDRDTQVELGRYVGDELFVVVVWRPQRPDNANQFPGVRVEWALTDELSIEGFLEDRFLRSASSTLGATGQLDNQQIWGIFLFRDWGY